MVYPMLDHKVFKLELSKTYCDMMNNKFLVFSLFLLFGIVNSIQIMQQDGCVGNNFVVSRTYCNIEFYNVYGGDPICNDLINGMKLQLIDKTVPIQEPIIAETVNGKVEFVINEVGNYIISLVSLPEGSSINGNINDEEFGVVKLCDPDCGIPQYGMYWIDFLLVPGSYEMNFNQDSCNDILLSYRYTCGNGEYKSVECTDQNCVIDCDYSSISDCLDGVCEVKFEACVEENCDVQDDSQWQPASETVTFKLVSCPDGYTKEDSSCVKDECEPTNIGQPAFEIESSDCNDNNACTNDYCIAHWSKSDEGIPLRTSECINKKWSMGCTLNDFCTPIGNRDLIETTPSYCSLSEEYITQKEENAECKNNYECKSNYCSANGKCYDITTKINKFDEKIQDLRNMITKISKFLKTKFPFFKFNW